VMGWSYGGYLTAFAITQTTRFRAASVGAGITNLVSYAGVADIPGFIGSYFGGEFWDAPELWQDRSAVLRVKAVTTPTLIQHGENDLRVPISQGYELYTALKRRHVPVTMVVYPRQGHGVGEPRLQLDVMRRNLEWFERWVMADRKLSREPDAEPLRSRRSDTDFHWEAGTHGAASPGVAGPRRVRHGPRLHGHVRLLRRPR